MADDEIASLRARCAELEENAKSDWERMQEMRSEHEDQLRTMAELPDLLRVALAAAHLRASGLVEALIFYRDNWAASEGYRSWPEPNDQLLIDGGKKAKAALGHTEPRSLWKLIDSRTPRDRPIIVWAPAAHGLPPLTSRCTYHPDAGFCIDELREPTHWLDEPSESESEPEPLDDLVSRFSAALLDKMRAALSLPAEKPEAKFPDSPPTEAHPMTEMVTVPRELIEAAQEVERVYLQAPYNASFGHFMTKAINKLQAALAAAPRRSAPEPDWQDKPLPEDAEIKAAHPLNTGEHALYGEALRLVGARRSKAGLVTLVHWLLLREKRAELGILAIDKIYETGEEPAYALVKFKTFKDIYALRDRIASVGGGKP